MGNIIRGTTPTIKYMFSAVNVNDIAVAYLTVRRYDGTVIEKTLSDATIGSGYLAWTLTQQETLGMKGNYITCRLNWRLEDGTRGASKQTKIDMERNDKEEVI